MTTEKPSFAARRSTDIGLWFIVTCLTIYVLNLGRSILIPFVIALFFWYLINAIARGLSRFNLPRVACFALAILFLCLGLWEIYELIYSNMAKVSEAAPVYQSNLRAILAEAFARLHFEHQPTIQELKGYLDIGGMAKFLATTLSGIAGKTVIVLFYTGFLLYEQRFFGEKLAGMVKDSETASHIHEILHNIDIKVQRYIWVKTLVSALSGLLTWAVLAVCHVDFASFWGVITFLLNFIPYIGSLLSIVLPSLIALVQFNDPTSFLIVLASLSAIHTVIGHGLDPWLMGENLNLSPIFIITSLAVWEMIWGIPGMFLAIPILAMIVITLAQFPATRPLAVMLSKTGVVAAEKPLKKRKK